MRRSSTKLGSVCDVALKEALNVTVKGIPLNEQESDPVPVPVALVPSRLPVTLIVTGHIPPISRFIAPLKSPFWATCALKDSSSSVKTKDRSSETLIFTLPLTGKSSLIPVPRT